MTSCAEGRIATLERVTDSPDVLPNAVEARPWRPGAPPIRRRRYWRMGCGPPCEVRLGGEWRRARVTARQDLADGRIVYHLHVVADTLISPRAVYWDPATLRPRD